MRHLKVIEVPFYILVIGMGVLERGNVGLPSALFLISIVRLWLNCINDNPANNNDQMNIGQMTITEAYTHLKPIAYAYGLKLNRAKDFKLARIRLVKIYNRELV